MWCRISACCKTFNEGRRTQMRIDGRLTASVPLATVCSARGRPLSEALKIHTHTVTKNKVVIMKNEQTPSDIFFKRFIFSFSNRYTAEQFTQNCLEQQQFYLQFSMAVSFTTWCKSNLALFVQA